MFTGIVREKGRVASFEGGRLVVESRIAAEIGDSVAVDGVCLTLTGSENGHLAFDVMVETLDRVKPFGNEVNLEPALRAGEPLGGHYVQGHVDGVGAVRPGGAGAGGGSGGKAAGRGSGSTSSPSCCVISSKRARSPSRAFR